MDEQYADGERGAGLPHHLPGDHVQRHAGHGEGDAEHRGAVLGDDRAQRRVPQPLGEPALAAYLVQGPQQGAALREQGDAEHDQPGHVAAEALVRPVAQGLGTLEEGEAAAHDEDADGREQRPEEAFLAVAEGVLAVGGAAAAAQCGEEEDLVHAVRDGVCRLRQQRGRPRDEPADGLGHRDHQVGREGHEHGDACPAVGPAAPLLFSCCPAHEAPTAPAGAAHTRLAGGRPCRRAKTGNAYTGAQERRGAPAHRHRTAEGQGHER